MMRRVSRGRPRSEYCSPAGVSCLPCEVLRSRLLPGVQIHARLDRGHSGTSAGHSVHTRPPTRGSLSTQDVGLAAPLAVCLWFPCESCTLRWGHRPAGSGAPSPIRAGLEPGPAGLPWSVLSHLQPEQSLACPLPPPRLGDPDPRRSAREAWAPEAVLSLAWGSREQTGAPNTGREALAPVTGGGPWEAQGRLEGTAKAPAECSRSWRPEIAQGLPRASSTARPEARRHRRGWDPPLCGGPAHGSGVGQRPRRSLPQADTEGSGHRPGRGHRDQQGCLWATGHHFKRICVRG